jgi:N-acyl-D-amino-acid deacylase
VLLLAEARLRGFAIDEANFAAQLDHTAAHLKRGQDNYLAGQGQGGRADTAGWALWTLQTGDRKPDETTAAVAHYLLTWQKDRDHWRTSGNRPPTEASDFTTTYAALRALSVFGTVEQRSEIGARRERALKWLLQAEAKDNEDRVFRLRSLHFLETDKEAVDAAAKELLAQQAADGGWGQLNGMTSDAYATGTTLVTLYETGYLSASDAEYRQGIEFLLRTQHDDGSWQVATRSKPIQVYFESGFPHAKDQFISISATSWAATALVLATPPR